MSAPASDPSSDRERVVLVTGGGQRVGRALALALGERGWRVAVHYHASDAGARETVRLIDAGDAERAQPFQADLRDAGACAELIRRVADTFGRLDALVNSAGVMLRTPVGDVSATQWDDMFAINLRAPFFLTQAAAPLLAERRGSVVNIADLAAFETWPAYVPHGISKAGVVQMTRALARTLAPGVRVNAIAPGAVLLPESWEPSAASRMAQTTPLGRIGSPSDVAQAMLYLLDAGYVTGETILVDGGRHVRC
ncbi:MAG TPA: SDR family oxidoreductase [Gemmatimonadaceae bacterium]|nr:SDR family oxidoreductase [Gemmatimonadaceae bacterium]